MPRRSHAHHRPLAGPQQGFSLVIVLMILVIVSILGVSGIQISLMGERSARNDRDAQIAWQAGEAALLDAEFDIEGQPASSTSKRNGIFKRSNPDIAQFVSGCGTSGQTRGLCQANPDPTGKAAWLSVDFTATGNTAPTTAFGTFTGRDFPSGTQGIQPTRPPRYVIEALPDPADSRTTSTASRKYIYRVTAMGFGPNAETQAVLQMLYRN